MRSPLRLVLPVACCAVALTHAQTPGRAQETKTREVYVSVLDRRGAPVQDVTPEDLTVREDGTAREVLDVRPAEEPLQIALLIDDSQAAMDSTSYIRDGVTSFIERLHGKGQIGLVTFGERPTVVAPYSQDTEELKKRATRIFPRTGAGAYLLDAISEAATALQRRNAERPTIVAVTFEGAVEYSNLQHTQVLETLRRTGVALHVLAIGSPSQSLSTEARNRGLVIAEGTQRTGGRREQVLSVIGLPEKMKQVADELGAQYLVKYSRPVTLIPPERLEVGSTKKNITVRARQWLGDS